MQDRPDPDVLLDAIAAFLATDVVPAIGDRGLAFRVRIAAHLLGGLRRDAEGSWARDRAHLESLREALGEAGPPPTDPADLGPAIRGAQRRLAEHIRTAPLDEADQAALRRRLRALLGERATLGQPRFDLSDRIEP